jgi:hypothetical protein
MNCPSCSSKAIMLSAWKGTRSSLHAKPNVLAQYQCIYGHFFATLRIFDGVAYQEHHAPSEKLTLVDRSSVN